MLTYFYQNFYNPDKFLPIFYALFLFLVGYVIASRASILISKALSRRFSLHHVLLFKRFTFYLLFGIFFVTGLQQLGFKLSVLLGAAGVFTVAISFASQTAASNLISGIFLLFEHPFKIGDTIEIKGINGVVDSIDFLSTKLKTSDNKLVRIPNEAMIKSEITNLSYFETRRLDLLIKVAYDSDITRVKNMLFLIAEQCKQVLKEPTPSVSINSLANSAMELKFMVWTNTADSSAVRNFLQETIKQTFDREGIKTPLPQVTLHQV